MKTHSHNSHSSKNWNLGKNTAVAANSCPFRRLPWSYPVNCSLDEALREIQVFELIIYISEIPILSAPFPNKFPFSHTDTLSGILSETQSPLTALPVPGAGNVLRDKTLPSWLWSRLIILTVVKHRPGRQRAGTSVKGNRKPSGPQGKDVFNSSSGPRVNSDREVWHWKLLKYSLTVWESVN